MLQPASGSTERSVGALLRDLADGSAQLLRQEWQLARLELYQLAKEIGRGTAAVAIAGVCFALGGASLLAGAALAFADPWVRSHAAIAIGAGVVALGAVVVWLIRSGIRTLVEADVAGEKHRQRGTWDNRRRKYAATSS
jgi:hypothetical protein